MPALFARAVRPWLPQEQESRCIRRQGAAVVTVWKHPLYCAPLPVSTTPNVRSKMVMSKRKEHCLR
jgi:hypothetical protein